MPIDSEEIKKALDSFENDEYVDAKDILKKEIGKARDEFISGKLGLKGHEGDEEEDSVDIDNIDDVDGEDVDGEDVDGEDVDGEDDIKI